MSQWLYQEEVFNIGNTLKQLRNKSGLTQEAVSAQLQIMNINVSRSTYSKMEMGTHGISLKVLFGLKQIFNAEYKDFFVDLP